MDTIKSIMLENVDPRLHPSRSLVRGNQRAQYCRRNVAVNQSKLYVETRDLYKARERLETKTSCVRIDFASLMGFYVKHDLKHTSCKIES